MELPENRFQSRTVGLGVVGTQVITVLLRKTTGMAFEGCHRLCPLCGLGLTPPNPCCFPLLLLFPEDSSTSLFKDLSSALAGMPEVSLNVDTPFPLEEELQIEPLSLDGLNMLSDSSMGLLDPSVEETFRADRL